MTNDFDGFRDDPFDENPDWLLDDDLAVAEPVEGVGTGSEDEFDQLRRKSARTGSMQDEMEITERQSTETRAGGSFSWSSFTPGQRLVLALLVVLDLIAIVFGVMVVLGTI